MNTRRSGPSWNGRWCGKPDGDIHGGQAGDGFTVRRHSGLTTYVEQDAFPDLNQAYRRLSLSGPAILIIKQRIDHVRRSPSRKEKAAAENRGCVSDLYGDPVPMSSAC